MRIIEDLQRIQNIIKGLRKVSKCPKNIDIPCIYCLECALSNYDEIEYEDGLLKMTTNSILLNMKIAAKEDIEKLLLAELIRAFSKHLTFILDTPEDGYEISFFFFHTDAKNEDIIRLFINFLKNIVPKLQALVLEGKMNIRRWASNTARRSLALA